MASHEMWHFSEDDSQQLNDVASAAEISSYVVSMLQGLRLLTEKHGGADLAFLDHLLEAAEDEAASLASRSLN